MLFWKSCFKLFDIKADRERIEKIEKTRYHSEVKPKIKQTKNQLNVLRTSFQVGFTFFGLNRKGK